MIWKKYQSWDSGNCEIAVDGEGVLVPYDLGVVETGRGRVFAGYFVRVSSPDGGEWIGEDAATILGALRIVDEMAVEDRCILMCAGLHDDFYESGLSHNSGFGYIKGYHQAFNMMARPRLLALDQAAVALASSRNSSRDDR